MPSASFTFSANSIAVFAEAPIVTLNRLRFSTYCEDTCKHSVSARRSFIVPTATMTVHPVRHSGVILGVPQTMRSFEQMQQRITGFVAAHSGMTEKRYTDLMLHTGELVMDMGTVLDGRRAVKEKLIDELGGLSDALAWLYKEIERK